MKPEFHVPAGAWDTHVHIFDTPVEVVIHGKRRVLPYAPAAALDQMHRQLGFERAVLVEAPGMKLAAHLERAAGRLRGVALINDDTTDAELAFLTENGVRGCRFHFYDKVGVADPDLVRRCLDRVAKFGWHVLLLIDARNLLAQERLWREAPVPIVIDHLAQINLTLGLHQPAMELILDLQRSRDTYIKVSSGDRRSRRGAPGYEDDIPFGRRVVENEPRRVLWATDWPHVLYKDPADPRDPPPDERDLLHLLFNFCRTQEDVDLILRDTPTRLYA